MPITLRTGPKNLLGSVYSNTYTMTIGGTGGAPTKGTIAIDEAWYCIMPGSKVMLLKYNYRQTVAGTSGGGSYLFSLPDGYQMDSSVVPNIVQNANNGGVIGCGWAITTTTQGFGILRAYDSTRFIAYMETSGGSFGNISNTFFQISGAAVVAYSFSLEIPLL